MMTPALPLAQAMIGIIFTVLLLLVPATYILGVLSLTFSFSGYRYRLGTLLCTLPMFVGGFLGTLAALNALGSGGNGSGWAWGAAVSGVMLLGGGLVIVRWWRRPAAGLPSGT